MGKVKHLKISLDHFGSYLGMERGCYIIKDKNGNIERYPQFENEIGEVILKSGNTVSVGALANFGFWDIDCLILTQRGRPVAMLKGLDDDSHVETRICQYEALKNGKGLYIAKQFLIGKIVGQNTLLNKYGLKTQLSVNQIINGFNEHDLVMLRRRLNHFEGKVSQRYFKQIFQLFPEKMRPTNRKGFQAYDGVNNIFNLSYKLLFWKCYRALIKCHLEPYLGFLHCIQPYRASLVCDLVELYRYLIDGFLIDYCQSLRPRDFVAKTEKFKDKNRKLSILVSLEPERKVNRRDIRITFWRKSISRALEILENLGFIIWLKRREVQLTLSGIRMRKAILEARDEFWVFSDHLEEQVSAYDTKDVAQSAIYGLYLRKARHTLEALAALDEYSFPVVSRKAKRTLKKLQRLNAIRNG